MYSLLDGGEKSFAMDLSAELTSIISYIGMVGRSTTIEFVEGEE